MKARASCSPSPLETNSITGGAASDRRARPAHRDAFIEEIHRHVQDSRHFEQAAGADAVDAFFVFLDLLEGKTHRSPSFSWLMPISMRRIRTRLPT